MTVMFSFRFKINLVCHSINNNNYYYINIMFFSLPAVVTDIVGSERAWPSFTDFCESVMGAKEEAERAREEEGAGVLGRDPQGPRRRRRSRRQPRRGRGAGGGTWVFRPGASTPRAKFPRRRSRQPALSKYAGRPVGSSPRCLRPRRGRAYVGDSRVS